MNRQQFSYINEALFPVLPHLDQRLLPGIHRIQLGARESIRVQEFCDDIGLKQKAIFHSLPKEKEWTLVCKVLLAA